MKKNLLTGRRDQIVEPCFLVASHTHPKNYKTPPPSVRDLLDLKRATEAMAKSELQAERETMKNNYSGETTHSNPSSSDVLQVTSPSPRLAVRPVDFSVKENSSDIGSRCEPCGKDNSGSNVGEETSQRNRRKRRKPMKFINHETEFYSSSMDALNKEDGVLNSQNPVQQHEHSNEENFRRSLQEVSVWVPSHMMSQSQQKNTAVPQQIMKVDDYQIATQHQKAPAATLHQGKAGLQRGTRAQLQGTAIVQQGAVTQQQAKSPCQGTPTAQPNKQQLTSSQQLSTPLGHLVTATQQLIVQAQHQASHVPTPPQIVVPVRPQVAASRQFVISTPPQIAAIPQPPLAAQQPIYATPSALYVPLQGVSRQGSINQTLQQTTVENPSSFPQAGSVVVQKGPVAVTGRSVLGGTVPVQQNRVLIQPGHTATKGTPVTVQSKPGTAQHDAANSLPMKSVQMGPQNNICVINNQMFVMVPVVKKPPPKMSIDRPGITPPTAVSQGGNESKSGERNDSRPSDASGPFDCKQFLMKEGILHLSKGRKPYVTRKRVQKKQSRVMSTMALSSPKKQKFTIRENVASSCSSRDSQSESDSALSRGAVAEILGEVDNKAGGAKKYKSGISSLGTGNVNPRVVTINGKPFPVKRLSGEHREMALSNLIKNSKETKVDVTCTLEKGDPSSVVRSEVSDNVDVHVNTMSVSSTSPDNSEREVVRDILVNSFRKDNLTKSSQKRTLDPKASHRDLIKNILISTKPLNQQLLDAPTEAEKPDETDDISKLNASGQPKEASYQRKTSSEILQITDSSMPINVRIKEEPMDTGYGEQPERNIFEALANIQSATSTGTSPEAERQSETGQSTCTPSVCPVSTELDHPVVKTEVKMPTGELATAFVHHIIKQEVIDEDQISNGSSNPENQMTRDSERPDHVNSDQGDPSGLGFELPHIAKVESLHDTIQSSSITIEPASPVSDNKLNEMLLSFASVSGSVEAPSIKQESADDGYDTAVKNSDMNSTLTSLDGTDSEATVCERPVKKKALPSRTTRRKRQTTYMSKRRQQKPHKCYNCGQGFVCLSKLEDHRRVHTDEKPWKCSTCGKCFARRDVMRRHVNIHLNDKQFVCEFCPKRFLYMYELSRHRRTHTGEKRFNCHLCGKRLSQMSGLKRHLATHEGEKPYPCNICKNHFVRKSVLVKHMGRRHKHIQALCPICGMGFRSKSAQVVHLSKHSGIKRNHCEVCRAQFSSRYWLKRHICGGSQSKS